MPNRKKVWRINGGKAVVHLGSGGWWVETYRRDQGVMAPGMAAALGLIEMTNALTWASGWMKTLAEARRAAHMWLR